MTTSKLPARPSLDSLRKQAKKLAQDIAAGNADALARARVPLPQAEPPLSHRDAQLVLAREYGFPGWQDLIQEVQHRLGKGLEWAASEARRVIHGNDVPRLGQLLQEYPALLSWRADENDAGLLGMATGSYGDSGDTFLEEHFTRKECAEHLLDAGAFIAPQLPEDVIKSRAKGLIALFHSRGLFPRTLKFLAALGDMDGVRARVDTNADDPSAVNEALMYACHLQHEPVAALLLDRAITLEPELGRRIDAGPGRATFIRYFIENKPDVHNSDPFEPWDTFVKQQVGHAMRDGDLDAFTGALRRDPSLLGEANVKLHARWIELAVLNDRPALLEAFFALDPAILRAHVPPPSPAIEFAFVYAKTHLLPYLLRIWRLPDDLPHAAGNGDLPRVKHWFDAEGKLALGDLAKQYPLTNAHYCSDFFKWFHERPNEQRVLDTALAWAVLNNHFDVAGFLLDHGADVNTNWGSHEPASILHELVWHKNYAAMQFLIDHGIDMTIKDYRWRATAEGWAAVAANDEKLAQFLHDSQQKREQGSV